MPQEPKKEPQKDEASVDPELQNEGEGSRSAARRYDEEAHEAAKDEKNVEELGKKAEEALDGPEGEKLREADARGKRQEHK